MSSYDDLIELKQTNPNMYRQLMYGILNTWSMTASKTNMRKQRNLLIDCISKHGYLSDYVPITLPTEVPQKTEEDELLDEAWGIMEQDQYDGSESDTGSNNWYVEEPDYCYKCGTKLDSEDQRCRLCNLSETNTFVQSIAERESSSVDPYGFNRSFIGPVDGGGGGGLNISRLTALQQRIMTSEEVEFNKVRDMYIDVLNEIPRIKEEPDLVNKIVRTAMNMFLNLRLYYAEGNSFHLGVYRASLRRGYIMMILLFAMKYSNLHVDREYLVHLFSDKNTKYKLFNLSQAEKNLKRIFARSQDYSFINETVPQDNTFCGMIDIIKQVPGLYNKIKKVIDHGVFKNISNNETSAILYYLTNDKSIVNDRTFIIVQGTKQRFTYEFIAQFCGNVAPATIKKSIQTLSDFYSKNPSKLRELKTIR